jgi:hypothetical protein
MLKQVKQHLVTSIKRNSRNTRRIFRSSAELLVNVPAHRPTGWKLRNLANWNRPKFVSVQKDSALLKFLLAFVPLLLLMFSLKHSLVSYQTRRRVVSVEIFLKGEKSFFENFRTRNQSLNISRH